MLISKLHLNYNTARNSMYLIRKQLHFTHNAHTYCNLLQFCLCNFLLKDIYIFHCVFSQQVFLNELSIHRVMLNRCKFCSVFVNNDDKDDNTYELFIEALIQIANNLSTRHKRGWYIVRYMYYTWVGLSCALFSRVKNDVLGKRFQENVRN